MENKRFGAFATDRRRCNIAVSSRGGGKNNKKRYNISPSPFWCFFFFVCPPTKPMTTILYARKTGGRHVRYPRFRTVPHITIMTTATMTMTMMNTREMDRPAVLCKCHITADNDRAIFRANPILMTGRKTIRVHDTRPGPLRLFVYDEKSKSFFFLSQTCRLKQRSPNFRTGQITNHGFR